MICADVSGRLSRVHGDDVSRSNARERAEHDSLTRATCLTLMLTQTGRINCGTRALRPTRSHVVLLTYASHVARSSRLLELRVQNISATLTCAAITTAAILESQSASYRSGVYDSDATRELVRPRRHLRTWYATMLTSRGQVVERSVRRQTRYENEIRNVISSDDADTCAYL